MDSWERRNCKIASAIAFLLSCKAVSMATLAALILAPSVLRVSGSILPKPLSSSVSAPDLPKYLALISSSAAESTASVKLCLACATS